MSLDESIIAGVTSIANARQEKKHPDMHIQEWQTRAVLEAALALKEEWEKKNDEKP